MNARALLLPALALLAVAAVIGVQILSGGRDFAPPSPPDPCRERPVGPRAQALENLAEQVVLIGVQRAACILGVSRERLVLALPSARDRQALARDLGRDQGALVAALKAGRTGSVTRLEGAGRLPRASTLLDGYAGQLGLPGFAEGIVRRIPAGVVDDLLPTGGVLKRAVADIDVRTVLRELDDPDALQAQLGDRIRKAALREARARLIQKIPAPIRNLLPFG